MLKKGTSKSALMVALVTGNVIWGGTVVHAEEPSQAFTLDPMVVTAQRMETRDLDTPAAVTVISSEEIKKSGAVNVDTLLAQQIGFNGMSYGPNGQEYGGSASRTKIRGLDKGTLVLVNGAPMNLLNYNAISNIPLDSIEKIEIVRGSNATLYGAEAMGGVINIITKKASGSAKTTISGTIQLAIKMNIFQFIMIKIIMMKLILKPVNFLMENMQAHQEAKKIIIIL